jgi:hypothetical protein
MGVNEDIIELRQKMAEAIDMDLFENETGGFVQVSLISIMKEAEKKRQACAKQAEHFHRQAVNAEGQAAAYGTISSIVNAVFRAQVNIEERNRLEEAAADAEEVEEVAAAKAEEEEKKTTRKTSTRKTSAKKKTTRKKR